MFVFFVFMFGFYAYSLFFGGYLRWTETDNPTMGHVYTGGEILSVMFSVMFGAFTLAGVAPHLKTIAEAKVGGYLAY